MKRVRVPCTRCKGCGTVELNGVYADTLKALAKSGETWAAALSRVMGCEATAMNSRLEQMEMKGLVTSRRYGRRRFFKVAG